MTWHNPTFLWGYVWGCQNSSLKNDGYLQLSLLSGFTSSYRKDVFVLKDQLTESKKFETI